MFPVLYSHKLAKGVQNFADINKIFFSVLYSHKLSKCFQIFIDINKLIFFGSILT